jgi:hypothetical protein
VIPQAWFSRGDAKPVRDIGAMLLQHVNKLIELLNSCPINLFLDTPTILGRAAETKHSTESNSSFIRSSRKTVVRAEGLEP